MQIVRIAFGGDGFNMGAGDHTHRVLTGHIQQKIQPAVPFKILGGNLGGVVRQGKLVHLPDVGTLSLRIFLYLDGIKGAGVLSDRKGRDGSGHGNGCGAQGGKDLFHGWDFSFFR